MPHASVPLGGEVLRRAVVGVLQDETAHEQLRVRPEQVHEDPTAEAFEVIEAQ
jgi:hypothetical protein